MKISLSTIVELLGLACVLVAAFAVEWRLGTAVVGTALILMAWQMDGNEVGKGGEP